MSSSSNNAVSSQCGFQHINPWNLQLILSQGHVVFTIGSSRYEVDMHVGLISQVSASLHALVAKQQHLSKYVELQDVEEDVFLRFCQFSYTGSYAGFAPYDTSAARKTALAGKDAEQVKATGLFANTKAAQGTQSPILGLLHAGKDTLKLPYSLASYQTTATGWADPSAWCDLCRQNVEAAKVPSKRKFGDPMCLCGLKRASHKKLEAIANFIGSDNGHVEPLPQAKQGCQEACLDRDSLIGHARVWKFAQKYDVPPLMELACRYMVHELTYRTISAHKFMPILEDLVYHVYHSRTTEGHKIRRLVPQFVACVAEDVLALPGWARLLERVPAFASDYAREITYRLA